MGVLTFINTYAANGYLMLMLLMAAWHSLLGVVVSLDYRGQITMKCSGREGLVYISLLGTGMNRLLSV